MVNVFAFAVMAAMIFGAFFGLAGMFEMGAAVFLFMILITLREEKDNG